MANSHVSRSAYCLNMPLHGLPWEWCYCYYLVLILLNALAEAYAIWSYFCHSTKACNRTARGSNFPIHRLKLEVPIYWIVTFSRQKSLVEQQRDWIQVLKQMKSHSGNSGTHPSTQSFWRPHTTAKTFCWQVLRKSALTAPGVPFSSLVHPSHKDWARLLVMSQMTLWHSKGWDPGDQRQVRASVSLEVKPQYLGSVADLPQISGWL